MNNINKHEQDFEFLDLEGLPEHFLTVLPGNFPYCVLTLDRMDSEMLGKIAREFDLEMEGHSLDPGETRYRVLCKNPQSGEHKLQALTLLAVSLVALKLCPAARLRLDLESDFKESLTDRKTARKPALPSKSGLLLDEACQLFLKQAGFEFEGETPEVLLGEADFKHITKIFLSQAGFARNRVGA
jgi:hypothetical protein